MLSGGQVFSASHPGAVRSENQDALLCRTDIDLYVVADGAGGHENGRAAADTVVAAIGHVSPALPVSDRLPAVRQHLAAAHEALLQDGRAASTVAVLMLDADFFVCLWAGDSRIYLWRAGEMLRITRDHSLVQEMVDAGTLTEAAARHHARANIITRAVGGQPGALQIEKRIGEAMPGDRFLLCSDGLTKAMEDDEICQHLGGEGDVAAAMLDTALRRHARDNVSAIVVRRD